MADKYFTCWISPGSGNREQTKDPSCGETEIGRRTRGAFEVNFDLTPLRQINTHTKKTTTDKRSTLIAATLFLTETLGLENVPTAAREEDTSSRRGWNILTKQVSLPALGSPLEEGRARFVFQHRPETADGCTS